MHARVVDTSSIEEHARLLRQKVDESLADPATRALAASIVSSAYEWVPDPFHGGRAPAIRYYDRYYRVAASGVPGVCDARDRRCEINAIWNFVVLNVRYTGDIDGFDSYQDARFTLATHSADCFPLGTPLLRDDFTFVPVEAIRPGEKIWGYDRWSTVADAWPKGELAVDVIRLNNGSQVALTPDHKVYVARCDRHNTRVASGPCACPITERRVERITVEQLQVDDVLLQPDRLPFGAERMDADRAYVEGLYLSDGWNAGTRFNISGLDGHPKEAQKREVEQICARLGVSTHWYRKSIEVQDKEWARRLSACGWHAPEKHALSINLEEGAAGALLRGILADSGRNTNGAGRTFTSTSRALTAQTRVLLRMFGRSASYRYIANHGGLGQNPIHRLGIRESAEERDGRASKLLRVREIMRGVTTTPCFDISTDDHYVYLPEHDVTVSNCDDFDILFGALLRAVGFQCASRIISQDGDYWGHVYPVVWDGRKWLPLDATEDGKKPGWEYPRARAARDFPLGDTA